MSRSVDANRSPKRSSIDVVGMIDHALLHPTLTDEQIVAGCRVADRLRVASVCVKPYAISQASEVLVDSSVNVGTVIGFPHGSADTKAKAAESDVACRAGASELDMVINVGKAIGGDWNYVAHDISEVVKCGRDHGALVKVIFETDYLTGDEQKRRLCALCTEAGADFVKTSTGFGYTKQESGDYNYRGATEHDVKLMRDACPDSVGVKASGGIRDFATALRFVELGASRLGTSASEAIAAGQSDESSY